MGHPCPIVGQCQSTFLGMCEPMGLVPDTRNGVSGSAWSVSVGFCAFQNPSLLSRTGACSRSRTLVEVYRVTPAHFMISNTFTSFITLAVGTVDSKPLFFLIYLFVNYVCKRKMVSFVLLLRPQCAPPPFLGTIQSLSLQRDCDEILNGLTISVVSVHLEITTFHLLVDCNVL